MKAFYLSSQEYFVDCEIKSQEVKDDMYNHPANAGFFFPTELNALQQALKNVDETMRVLQEKRDEIFHRILEQPVSDEKKNSNLKWVQSLTKE